MSATNMKKVPIINQALWIVFLMPMAAFFGVASLAIRAYYLVRRPPHA